MKKILLSTILVTTSLSAFATTETAMKSCMNAWQNKQYMDAITYCKPLANPTDLYAVGVTALSNMKIGNLGEGSKYAKIFTDNYDPKAPHSDNVKKIAEELFTQYGQENVEGLVSDSNKEKGKQMLETASEMGSSKAKKLLSMWG
ncbi:hypothetical protein [Francisella sp. LA112445]|uniref:hypothetical protein n=1 Tax=Francisella sp. LA112445 TaxID=1395624 RepID=UPI001788D26B|nr:hypothetical protein [Francisella sp. LA112445]QIW09585.1 hypothetical protein FIP56_02405 [Francisella sp. LA112445]